MLLLLGGISVDLQVAGKGLGEVGAGDRDRPDECGDAPDEQAGVRLAMSDVEDHAVAVRQAHVSGQVREHRALHLEHPRFDPGSAQTV